MQRHPLRSLMRTGTLLLAGTVALAACGGDDENVEPTKRSDEQSGGAELDQTPDDGVALLAAGEPEKVALTPQYEVGQRATSTMDMDLGLAGAGQSVELGMQMVFTSEVTEVAKDSSTAELTFDEVRLTDGPAEAESRLRAQFEPIIGQTLVIEYDENGQVVGDVRLENGEELPAELRSSFESVSQTAFPTEEVGVGSRWSAVIETASNGVELEVTTVYELVEIADDELVIDVSQELPLDEEIDGESVEGQLNGSGQVIIDRANPLLMDMTYRQQTDVSAEDMSMNLDMTIDVRSE